jgi:hypothetical protein
MNIKSAIKKINNRNFTNNTQKVAYRLLNADGSWVSRKDLERSVASASARVRDLRKDKFGAFTVDCASAVSLNRRGDRSTFFYRIRPTSVKKMQFQAIFGS